MNQIKNQNSQIIEDLIFNVNKGGVKVKQSSQGEVLKFAKAAGQRRNKLQSEHGA